MTTQELKQYIDKVLGNNLRCLLPSYWWKRLFHHVADRIDEVEQSTSELIETKVNEVKMPIVESVDELNKLDLPKGSIAKVASEYSIVNVEDCYLPNGENIVAEWDKLTPIRKVEVLGYNGSNICQILLSAKVNDFGDCVSAAYDANNNNYVYSKGSFVDQTSTELSKSEFDALLLERDYRYAASLTQGELTVDSVFTLYTDSSTADAYIKGDTWTRLLKEGEGGSNITVDTELSSTSENPVQNKVIYENLYEMSDEYTQMYEELGASVHEMSVDLYTKLLKKVDYVAGKQLSTEDFTSALKAKLEGLSNYDDTSIQNAVNSLTTQINTLVSGDASTAIESFNEIIAFLNGVEDSESLDSIIAAIEQQIAGKQDKLVSGTNIKTINGESILGEGNIVVNVDTSNLATKEELTSLTNEMIANEEVVAAALNDLNTRLAALEAAIANL